MASLTRLPDGKYQVSFKAPNGKRQTIRLGEASDLQAQTVKTRIEKLMVANRLGIELDPATLEWLMLTDDRIHGTLAKCGLTGPRGPRTIGELTTWYHATHSKNRKPQTVMNITRATQPLMKFFSDGRRLVTISTDEAEQFRNWLLVSGSAKGGALAPATASRTCRRCRQLFSAAVKLGGIRNNPFGEMRKWNETNPERDCYVAGEVITKLTDATADLELRVIITLARFAGLRCPSEIQPLEWSWVDWGTGCIQAASPKTEHHDGHARRIVPMFPEVRSHVDRLWAAAPDGAKLMLPRHQGSRTAITNRLQTLCRKVGIVLWEKPWVNMRASCERDLLKKHPIDDVAAWLGHSPTIALKHYNRAVAEVKANAAASSMANEAHACA